MASPPPRRGLDQYTAEMFVGDRARASHGKGMRAVPHAAFAVE
ncbi:hypothetical protein [Streptomyces sp. NPDC005077]